MAAGTGEFVMRLVWNHEIAIARTIHTEHRDQGNRGNGFLVTGSVVGALMWVGLLSLVARLLAALVG
jgi:hypothetical protein